MKKMKQIGGVIFLLFAMIILHTEVEAATTDGYEYSINEKTGEVTITGYDGGKSDLTIPREIDGKKVTVIGVNAFRDNKSIIYITIPGTIETISGSAFLNATSLKEVTIESGCKTILASAFILCSNLEKIIIPASVTNMEYINSGSETFGGVDLKKIAAYIEPGSATQTYFDTYEEDIPYYYFDKYNPSELKFSKPSITINVGETYQFSKSDFNVSPSTAYITEVTDYESSDINVAYVSDGVLKPRKVGTMTVTATIQDKHLKNSVTTKVPLTINVVESRKAVENVDITVDGVSVHNRAINMTNEDLSYMTGKNRIVMYEGDTIQLGVTVSPTNALYTGEWRTYNSEGIVSVDANGLVTALKEGPYYQQVFYNTHSEFGNVYEGNGNFVEVEVIKRPTTPNTPSNPNEPTNPVNPNEPTPQPPKQEGHITLNASKISLQKGKTIKTLEFKTNRLPGDKIVSVTSGNKKVLKATLKGQTISLKGLKTYKKYVNVTVTMQSGAKATCKVKVVNSSVKTKNLSISDKKVSLLKGESQNLTIARNPIGATDKITWKSSNTKVATVNKNGKVKTKSAGKATITATSASGKKVSCKVTVTNVLNADTLNLQKGKTITALKVTAKQLRNDSIVSVKSSNKKVLRASLDGQTIVLKGLKTNSKYVTMTVKMTSGAKGTCKVKVVKSKVETQKLSLTDKKLSLKAGESSQLEAVRNPISAMDKITWKSSNKKVATIDKDGNITAIKKGKTTITATVNQKKATCKITVK